MRRICAAVIYGTGPLGMHAVMLVAKLAAEIVGTARPPPILHDKLMDS